MFLSSTFPLPFLLSSFPTLTPFRALSHISVGKEADGNTCCGESPQLSLAHMIIDKLPLLKCIPGAQVTAAPSAILYYDHNTGAA
jgi:hypothetical protein